MGSAAGLACTAALPRRGWSAALDPVELLTYPNGNIRLVIPWPPAGGADRLGRLLGEQLAKSLEQRVAIDNRPGAGGSVGAQFVANAKADGYTLLISASDTHIVNPVLYGTRLPFKGVDDFAPVALLASADMALAVHPSVSARTVDALVVAAREAPRRLRFATSGPATRGHLLTRVLERRARIDVMAIPYQGSAAAATAVAGGVADAVFCTYSAMEPHLTAGKLRLLAVSSKRPAPGGAALSELIADFELDLYFGLFAPRGTPREIVERLNLHANKALERPEVRTRLATLGFAPQPATPAEFEHRLRIDELRWQSALAGLSIPVE